MKTFNRLLLGFFLSSAPLQLCASEKGSVPLLDFDSKIDTALFSHISNLPTAEFSLITVGELEQELSKIAQLSRAGVTTANYRGVEYRIVHYSIYSGPTTDGLYMLDMLTKPTNEGEKTWRVVGARMIYTSRSGVSYYDYLIPRTWPIEMQKGV